MEYLAPGFGVEARNCQVKVCFGEAVEGGGGSDGVEDLVFASAAEESIEQRGLLLLALFSWHRCGGGDSGELVWFESDCGP